MRRVFLPILMLAGLLQILQPAGAQVPGKKPAPAPKKRKVAVRKPPPVDPTRGDNIDGDDLTVRRAAVEALGAQNGSVVVVDPSNGRVLSVVNQKLAFSGGFTPCSTIKLVTALAALSEHVVERDDTIRAVALGEFRARRSHRPFQQRVFRRVGQTARLRTGYALRQDAGTGRSRRPGHSRRAARRASRRAPQRHAAWGCSPPTARVSW